MMNQSEVCTTEKCLQHTWISLCAITGVIFTALCTQNKDTCIVLTLWHKQYIKENERQNP